MISRYDLGNRFIRIKHYEVALLQYVVNSRMKPGPDHVIISPKITSVVGQYCLWFSWILLLYTEALISFPLKCLIRSLWWERVNNSLLRRYASVRNRRDFFREKTSCFGELIDITYSSKKKSFCILWHSLEVQIAVKTKHKPATRVRHYTAIEFTAK